MKPSSAVGTFLRYWRSEWAGLSRAQLALAVAAQCKRKRVTEAMVRAWERGQPPADTEELDALLAVMRRHGLSEPEIGHVRRAIFAACLDRHYPELFPAEEFAESPDVDELAEASLGGWPQAPASRDPVELVGQLTSLERAVGSDIDPAPPGSQRRRQQVALVFSRSTMSWYCDVTDRKRQMIAQLQANLRSLEDCFGPGGAGYCTARFTRRTLLLAIGYLTGSDEAITGMLELSRQFEAEGESWMAADAFSTALSMASRERRDGLWPQVERHLGNTPLILDGEIVPAVWDKVFERAISDGRLDLAERIVPIIEPWRHGGDWQLQYWHQRMGPLAFYRGDLGQAEEHFGTCLRMAKELGGPRAVLAMHLWLRACEEARKQRSYDPAQLDDEVQREVKRITRAPLEGPANPAR